MPPPNKNQNTMPENQDADSDRKSAEDQNNNVEIPRTRQVASVRSYSGPIPSAEEFARYEEALPGSADRLLSMAEQEQAGIVSFRNKSLVAATVVAIVTIIAITVILSTNPNSLILIALATAHVLPSITDFIRGMADSALSRKERELEIQIRKDNHELDMITARERLQLTSGSDEPITQKARRLESGDELTDLQEGSQ